MHSTLEFTVFANVSIMMLSHCNGISLTASVVLEPVIFRTDGGVMAVVVVIVVNIVDGSILPL